MKTVYLTVRVDFDTDSQEDANDWGLELRLMDERQTMNKKIESIEVCDINDDFID